MNCVNSITVFNLFLYCSSRLISAFDVTKHRNWNLLDHEECGISLADRIIGGTNANLGQFPWIARIEYESINRGYSYYRFKCGGALISKMYVLTAGHCVTGLPVNTKVSAVRLGENDAATSIDCNIELCAEPVQDFGISKIILHEKYNVPVLQNDIALIRLNRSAVFNGWVQSICIPYGVQLTKNYEGSTAEVAGWGISDMGSLSESDRLLYVKLPIIPLEICSKLYSKYASVDQSQLCVGGKLGEDSCRGDSGGPLIKAEAVHKDPRYYVLGIVSFGAKECGTADAPGIYTKVASYVVWLLDNLSP